MATYAKASRFHWEGPRKWVQSSPQDINLNLTSLYLLLACLLVSPSLGFAETSESHSFAKRQCVQEGATKYGHSFLPNCTGDIKNSRIVPPFRTNAKGLVGVDDYAPYPRSETFRVLFLGSSAFTNARHGVGVIPSMEKVLKRNWKKMKSRYKAIEVVNGSIDGYTLVNLNLIAADLLDAYHPDLVVLDWPLIQIISEHIVHESAESHGPATGLVDRIGQVQHFWPFPRKMVPMLWKLVSDRFGALAAVSISAKCQTAQIIFLRLTDFVKNKMYRPKVYPEYSWVLRYIEAIQKKATEHGAGFMLTYFGPSIASLDRAVERYRKKNLWYIPALQAEKVMPYRFLQENVDFINTELKSKYTVLDWSDLEDLYVRSEEPNDIHFSDEGMHAVGEALGERIFPFVAGYVKSHKREEPRESRVK